MDHKKTKLDADMLWARIRSVERFVWAKLPDASVGSSQMGKRVVFCAWTKDWRVRASMNLAAFGLEPFDPDEIASALAAEMRMAIDT